MDFIFNLIIQLVIILEQTIQVNLKNSVNIYVNT